jgi:hypothetical protein
MDDFYEREYWKEVEENLKLQEVIEHLKWKIHSLENKLEIQKLILHG